MFKIPHKVRIKYRASYEVVWVDKFDDPLQNGECRWPDPKDPHRMKQIVLKKGMSAQLTWDTFVHEVTHAVCNEYDIQIPHNQYEHLELAFRKLLTLNKWVAK